MLAKLAVKKFKPQPVMTFACVSCGYAHPACEGGYMIDRFHCVSLGKQPLRMCLGRQFENLTKHNRRELGAIAVGRAYALGAKLTRYDDQAIQLIGIMREDRSLVTRYLDVNGKKLTWVVRNFYPEAK